jgi:putative ABC transport system ATP-binding protein
MTHIVSVNKVFKNYTLGTFVVPALRGVSLDVEEGEFLSIAGPSGSGKTTLLNLIGCVDTPTEGTVQIDGNPTNTMSERQLTRLRLHTIGFIFQSFNLVSVLSVFQNIELPLLLQRSASVKERRERVFALLESAFVITPITGQASFPVASASVSPSRAPWSRDRNSCWPTNPPRTWIR